VPVVTASATPAPSCSTERAYVPQPAWSGPSPQLPAIPALPTTPLRNGDAYTVYGAAHELRSIADAKQVTSSSISIIGYVVDSTIPSAPPCARHRQGQPEPESCEAPLPSFWIADDTTGQADPRVRVVGWARNYSVVFDAMAAYRKLPAGKAPDHPLHDDILGVDVPFPLPAVGMRVKVTGTYNTSRVVGTSMASDPLGGVMSFQKWEVLEPAPAPAAFAPR
jgi:hypothetical protein